MTREDKKTIIAEIDRLYQVNLGFKKEYRFPSFRRVVIGRLQAYEGLKSYINSLPEPQLPSDVEEAAEKYATEWHKNPDGSAWKPYFEESAIKAFKAGAEWQYQKDRGEFAKIKAKTWKEGFDFYKEQMLKGAVEGEVYKFGAVAYVKEHNNAELTKYLSPFNHGDSVKIVIVKEDKE